MVKVRVTVTVRSIHACDQHQHLALDGLNRRAGIAAACILAAHITSGQQEFPSGFVFGYM